MLYQGWPCRFAGSADLPNGDGVEHRVISAIHEIATEHRQPDPDIRARHSAAVH